MSHPDPGDDSYAGDHKYDKKIAHRCPRCYPRQGALRKLEGSTRQTWLFCDGCGGTWSLAECLILMRNSR